MNRFLQRTFILSTLGMLSLASTTRIVDAQSAQPVSLQLSGFGTSVAMPESTTGTSGFGVEPQLRLNHLARSESLGTLSLGIGGQYTKHTAGAEEITITGGFVEPRWVPPFSFADGHLFPYLAARIALLRQSNNFGTGTSGTAFGGGGGLAIAVNRQLNLDIGAAFVQQKFDNFAYYKSATRAAGAAGALNSLGTYAVKAGLSYGFGK